MEGGSIASRPVLDEVDVIGNQVIQQDVPAHLFQQVSMHVPWN